MISVTSDTEQRCANDQVPELTPNHSKSSVKSVVWKFQNKLYPRRYSVFKGRKGRVGDFFCSRLIVSGEYFIDFLQEVGLICSVLLCENCNLPMIITEDNGPDVFSWICTNTNNNTVCGNTKTIRNRSWFMYSNLTLSEMFLLAHLLVSGRRTSDIKSFCFDINTINNWRMFVTDIISEYLELSSEKIGGIRKVVEIDLFKWRSMNSSKDECWVLGGIDRETRKLVLAAIPDRTEETLINIIKKFIEPGTSVYSDCWKTDCLRKEVIEQLTVEYKISLIDSLSIHDTKGIARRLRKVESFLPCYEQASEIQFYLTLYLFRNNCNKKRVGYFVKFLEIMRDIDWEKRQPNQMLYERVSSY